MKSCVYLIGVTLLSVFHNSWGHQEFRLYSNLQPSSYLSVNYQNPNQLSYVIYKNNVATQSIYLDSDLGINAKKIDMKNGIMLQGNNRTVTFKLNADDEDFTEYHIFQELTKDETAENCVVFEKRTRWYGGPEQQSQQFWPIEKQKFDDYAYVTKAAGSAAVTERYWLNSDGGYIYVSLETPLLIRQTPNEELCIVSEKKEPYNLDDENFVFDYYIGAGKNAKIAHMKAVELHLGKPTGIPDERMIKHPIWSTWARYKRDINSEIIEQFSNEILENGFSNSQLEIDDDWETCYGALTFNEKKFPDMKATVESLKKKGYRVTLWIHPFINTNCQPWYDEAKSKGFLAKDNKNNYATTWWNSQSGQAAHVDFTNPEAAKWFTDRLNALKADYGIDSFKFDAGESSWVPANPVLSGDKVYHPSTTTVKFVETLKEFGNFIEVRVGWGTQKYPIFVRMLDKDSSWKIETNGLQSLVTTLLQMNINGYNFVLPDMVGGNGYGNKPDKELFIRWLEANVFMPSIQFSYVPWDYDNETVAICKKLTELHENFATPLIIEAMKKTVEDGTPVNAPIWWLAPKDKEARGIGDEFLLGETVLVAPVLQPKVTSRDIYLPEGTWHDAENKEHLGPIWLRDYPAPLGTIPYFVRK